MTPKHLCILLLAAVATSTVAGQSEDIPIENDNQFPPEKHLETDETIIEGSGVGAIEEPVTTESTSTPRLEEIQNRELNENVPTEPDQSCPSQCVCHIEGGSDGFVVDCSGYELTEFPSPIDPSTTTLNIQNNKLTEIPKVIASLKNLKVLNADNNSIKDLAPGSISELSELEVLKLSNNRLIEFPQDLRNSFGLLNLQELNLGGNDMRTILKPESFSNFKSLRILTLPTSTDEFAADLCTALSGSLETVCTESCSAQSLNCLDALPKNEDDLLDATLPGMIAYDTADDNDDPIINTTSYDNADPAINTINNDNTDPIINKISNDTAEPIINTTSDDNAGSGTEETPQNDAVTSSTTGENSTQETEVLLTSSRVNSPEEVAPAKFNSIEAIPKDIAADSSNGISSKDETDAVTSSITDENATHQNEASLTRSRVNSPEQVAPAKLNSIVDTPKDEAASIDTSSKDETDVKVGATTADSNNGGVSKSVIGFIVAGMVIAVAGITIKKNWSSIRKRFSSTPRSPERPGANGNANGTAPEEVPLQDKNPV